MKPFSQNYLKIFGHRNYQRFAVIGTARTGSNYLLLGLNSSNCIKMYNEVFAKHNRKIAGKPSTEKGYDQIFSELFRQESRKIKAVGFKLFYEHFSSIEWEKFIAHQDFKIIHLTRRNYLRAIVSLAVAYKTGQWSSLIENSDLQSKDKQPVTTPLSKKRISLNISNLIERMELIRHSENFTRKRFKDRHILEVTYKKLTKNPIETFKRVGEYLGVKDIDFSTNSLKKQNPESLEQLIINYEEVYRLLKDTKFAEFLNS